MRVPMGCHWSCGTGVSGMHFWPSDCFAFVGYNGETPVSSAAALPINGTVYIALVATDPEQQGKGFAETVMRRAIAEGQRAMGVRRTTLHASMMEIPSLSGDGIYAKSTTGPYRARSLKPDRGTARVNYTRVILLSSAARLESVEDPALETFSWLRRRPKTPSNVMMPSFGL